ncbi:microtubule-associated protein futsch-like [Lytechinus pictus]|uniref:microtubule-associated protein futsch-like n=1 Tax=Lytechinus pictus TaxID=7653 RepID=UPI0030B9DF64
MATSDDASLPRSTSAGFPDSLTHFLLVVVGEPLAEDKIDLILAEVEKGLKNWNIDGDAVDYNDVLKSVAEASPIKTGLVHVSFGYAGAHLGIVVLINPTSEHLSQELRGLLAHPAANKHVSYGGHSLEGTGDWVLHDDTYTLHDIAEVFSEPDVDAALLKVSQDEKQTLCLSGCHWSTAAVTKQPFSKSLNLAINPQDAKHEVDGVSVLLETIRSRIEVPSPFDVMEPPTMGVGIKCKITKPTVLIFPAAKGDCAFFAVSDFSLFVGGGYSIKSCFWKFAKHLHRVDAVILPHTRPDTVIGINSLLKRKIAEKNLEAPEIGAEGYENWQIKCNSPEIGVVYMNVPDNKQSPNSLVLKTVSQGNETTKLLQQLSIKPFPCTANGGKEIKPITLYLKVGIGKLDMYILSPTQDSKELKDFLQQWSAGKAFSKVKTGVKVNGKESEVPLPNACSICALMVWQPASPQENIVRVLFPGNAPQSKIIEGLDRVKHLEFLKYPDAVQASSGKITAMKKKDVTAMKKAAANALGAANGVVNGKPSQTKEVNACTDGVHCNTPPPSPTGVCIDGKNCNTPPPANICADGAHCNTPPPENICYDGKNCNTPPPDNVCLDGEHCNTPPPENICYDGKNCNTPPPDNVCLDGEHCNTPPPENICYDGKNCNTPPPDNVCLDGEHCNTPPPENICYDGKNCNTPPPDNVCLDGEHCNTPPPENICYDGKNCNTPPPDNVCLDGEHCNTPPPEKDVNEDDAANFNQNQQPVKFSFDGVKGNDNPDNTCYDGVNCNTPPPEEDYEQNGVNGNVDGIAAVHGGDESYVASGNSQLPESQQEIESDVNLNPTSPALAKIDTTRLHGRDSPERLASGEITPADLVEYGMDEESDGFSSGHGTVGNTPDQPEPPSDPTQDDFVATAYRPSDRDSPEIQSEQPSSGVDMEDASTPSDQPHPWEPTIELSTDSTVDSAPAQDTLLGSPEIQVTEPAEMVSEARDSENNVSQHGALEANCELDESSEEISQASEIEVKPSIPEDEAEDMSDPQPELMQYDSRLEEENTKPESFLPEAEGNSQSEMESKEPLQAETDDAYSVSNAPEAEQELDVSEDTTDSRVPTTEPEADQQDLSEESHLIDSQFVVPQFAAPQDFGDEVDITDETKRFEEEIPKETDLDEAIKERDLDEVQEGEEVVQETNLDEVEPEMTQETDLDDFAMGVQQELEADVSPKQKSSEQFNMDVSGAVEVDQIQGPVDPIGDIMEQWKQPNTSDVEEVAQSLVEDTNLVPEEFDQTEQLKVEENRQEIIQDNNDTTEPMLGQSELPGDEVEEIRQGLGEDLIAPSGFCEQTESEIKEVGDVMEQSEQPNTSDVEEVAQSLVEDTNLVPEECDQAEQLKVEGNRQELIQDNNDTTEPMIGQSELPEDEVEEIRQSLGEDLITPSGFCEQTESEIKEVGDVMEQSEQPNTSDVEEVAQSLVEDTNLVPEECDQAEQLKVEGNRQELIQDNNDTTEPMIGQSELPEDEVEEIRQSLGEDLIAPSGFCEQTESEVKEVGHELDQAKSDSPVIMGQSEQPEEDEVEEVRQSLDDDTNIAPEFFEKTEQPDDALIQESAQEIVQEAVGAAVGVVERDQILSEDTFEKDEIPQDTVLDSQEDFGTDVDAGRDNIPPVEERYLLEENDVKEEMVSVTEPTISDSLEQNATDSLEDLQNDVASDVDIPPVIEEEVTVHVEEKQEVVAEESNMPDVTLAPTVDVGEAADIGEENVVVPGVEIEMKPEPAAEPVISDEAVTPSYSSPPIEEQSMQESKESDTVLKEPDLLKESLGNVLESPTVQEKHEIQSKTVIVESSSISVSKSTKSSNESSGKRTPSPVKSSNKNLKDKDKTKKATDKTKASDSKAKTGNKSPLSSKTAEKKTSVKTSTTPALKKAVSEKKTPSETKSTVRKSLVDKKASEKKPAEKKTPSEKKTAAEKKIPADKKPPQKSKSPTSSRGTEKKSSSLASKSSQQESSVSTDGPSKKVNGVSSKSTTQKKTSTLASTPTSRPGAKQPDSRPSTGGRPTSGAKKAGDSKKTSDRPTKSAPSSRGDAKSNGVKKATSKTSQPSKATSIPASGPAVHLDLAYIPNHASADSINSEFFRRVRAKNYVISANDKSKNQPAVAVLDALLEGKMKWEDTEAEVTVIPTYDYLSLRDWELTKHQELSKAKIEISQPACRSIVQMKDENFFMYKVEL